VVSHRAHLGQVALNRIDLPGTAEHSWDGWARLRRLPALDPPAWPSAVIVAAHPDDEVLGAGGTMAILAVGGARLRLLAVTDGEASHPGTDPQATARTRIAESAGALRRLGLRDIEVIRLRLPDAGLAACEDELSDRLGELCAGFEVCLAPWEADAHADHEAAGRAARRAARRNGQQMVSFPIWMWHWAKPRDRRVPWQRAWRIPLSPDIAARKSAAISAFTSQLTNRENAEPVLPAGIVAHFTRDQEVLFR
jgi:LmbE family N-acetylglucosaminyl deacetylase